jgi:hypothetical protein
VNVPRFRIAWVMVAVAIAALDFGAIRALLARHVSALDDQRSMCLLLGGPADDERSRVRHADQSTASRKPPVPPRSLSEYCLSKARFE